MSILYVSVLGIAILDGHFTDISLLGIPLTYIAMFALGIAYIDYISINKGRIRLSRSACRLFYLEIYCFIIVVLSILGINKLWISEDVFTSVRYVPRQAFYLFFLPAIFLFQERRYTRGLDSFLDRYEEKLFWLIYVLHIAYTKQFALRVSTVFILAWLALRMNDCNKDSGKYFRTLVLVFTPIAVGGEMTNMLIRVIYLCCMFGFKKHQKVLVQLMSAGMVAAIACMFALPVFQELFEEIFDANSFWRLRYWKDELTELARTGFLGVGYGTAYATERFVGLGLEIENGPFAPSSGYSTIEKMFVTGPHNSFISLAFRLGIVGVALFLGFLQSVLKGMNRSGRVSAASYFLYFSAIVIIGVNVGLESPFYLILFVFAMGRCVQEECLARLA